MLRRVMRFFETVHAVYFDDLDAFQILHNARYVLLFERTIGAFLRTLAPTGTLTPETHPDHFHLVRANHVEYIRPVQGTGQLRVRVWVEKLGTTSLTFGFRALPLDEDVDYATGTRVVVKIDPVTRKPQPWSEGFKKLIEPYRHDLTAGLKPPAP